jgi:hypothetical protein
MEGAGEVSARSSEKRMATVVRVISGVPKPLHQDEKNTKGRRDALRKVDPGSLTETASPQLKVRGQRRRRGRLDRGGIHLQPEKRVCETAEKDIEGWNEKMKRREKYTLPWKPLN